MSQHMSALAKANEIRFGRARLKRDLRQGRVSLAEVMEHEHIQSMGVFDLICAQWAWGPTRARQALVRTSNYLRLAFPFPENKTVGSLTDRQKRALLLACGCQVEGLAV